MDADDNATTSPAPATQQRRSGRAVRAVQKYSPEPSSQNNAKRKRGHDQEDGDEENDAPDAEDEEGSGAEEEAEEDDGGADDAEDSDEPTPRPRKTKSKPKASQQQSRAKKPAVKRPKVNGSAPEGVASAAAPIRLPSRTKKNVKLAVAEGDDGLYGEIFASGDSSDDVAGQWFQRYQNNDAEAMAELVNCVLRAAGCEHKLNEDDIRDPDNSAARLTELEEAFESTAITDYPLISRTKGTKDFRSLLLGFFESLISLLHQTEVLYTDEELLDNIQRWIGTMSSSALRPFRHTATTVGLAMLSALIEVTKQLDERITKSNQAIQAESNRKGKNKTLVENTKIALESAIANRSMVDAKSKDLFDIVFVHRYRDIDPKIRAECIEALGTWICTLPTVYMSPEYLRYLGWLLSDVSVTTRQEVLKQLGRVLKRDADSLAHFIDRFRPRLVEMATRDADVSVRVAAVSVVDVLRASGMLEPEEIDSVSRLLFDFEPRVRRAVVGFFTELVQEVIESKIDDIGGSDALDEALGDDDDNENYEAIRKDWINIKALAENLAVYDSQLDGEQDDLRHGLDVAADVVNANTPDSRIALAAQALYEKVPEINNWQILAGYLLFDHTTSSRSNSRSKKSNTIEAALKKVVAPEPREEAILLEVLATAVKESLSSGSDGHDRSRRKAARPDADAQEEASLQLAEMIPQLLNKFGPDPAMAATILRLEHYLDLDIFQHLRQNSITYEKILDEITIQFNRHVDQVVLNETAASLIHARQYEEFEEAVDGKLSGLWDTSINALRAFDKTCELSTRGNLDRAKLSELSHTLMKISKLCTVANCTDVLEAPGTSIDSDSPTIKLLIGTVHRGKLVESNENLDDPEDELVGFAIKASQFYFMWKVTKLRSIIAKGEDISNDEVDRLVLWRKEFITNLIHTFSSRGFNDDLRLMAVGSACDVCGIFVFLRDAINGPQASKYGKLKPLLEEMPHALITKEIIPIFDSAERAYAKKANKTLNESSADDDLLDLDDELPPEDDEDEELTEQERVAAELKAEKILCELAGKLVMAVLAKVLDNSGPHAGMLRKRMTRNKTKLGPTFKEVISYLDEDHLRELRSSKKKASGAKGSKPKEASKRPALSTELVIDDDDDDEAAAPRAEEDPFNDDDVEEPEEGTVEDLRRRELLDDPIEDDDEADEPAADRMEEDSVIGD
ncbi:putative nuclear protein SA-1 [Microdochium trichocladiopsis]|uniref:Nuclear protein SA-1 n=1 Tax=Microdochium trichocladiopsis TaxID=1682393 RepID=A0A9P8Y6U9_9PEZI|nr:putative nuclear protein SA-1 [Microdochium trichocladiopsis]KAH7033225.1 putative nuclear protein SA-1 [Microdochium trichocladiopsis]